MLCMYNFVLNLFYLLLYFLAKEAANSIKRICASGWFVGMENNNCRPPPPKKKKLTFMFKNILRTFEAEILKLFKNI